MNIDMIKQEVDEKQSIKDEIYVEMKHFYELMNQFEASLEEKMKNAIEKILEEAATYFKTNGFTIKRENKTHDIPDGTTMIANYGESQVTIKNINYQGEQMQIYYGSELLSEFLIGTPQNVPNYFLWDKYVDICGTKLCTVGSDADTVYNHYVQPDTCVEELYVIQDEIDGNIKNYEKGIYRLEYVNLVLYNAAKTSTYKNFKEMWDLI